MIPQVNKYGKQLCRNTGVGLYIHIHYDVVYYNFKNVQMFGKLDLHKTNHQRQIILESNLIII